MIDKHLPRDDAFPEDLEKVPDHELQVLDSQVQRQLDHEVVTKSSTTATSADGIPGIASAGGNRPGRAQAVKWTRGSNLRKYVKRQGQFGAARNTPLQLILKRR
jgi:hypothetical protein